VRIWFESFSLHYMSEKFPPVEELLSETLLFWLPVPLLWYFPCTFGLMYLEVVFMWILNREDTAVHGVHLVL